VFPQEWDPFCRADHNRDKAQLDANRAERVGGQQAEERSKRGRLY
jgi:hypothetical protein